MNPPTNTEPASPDPEPIPPQQALQSVSQSNAHQADAPIPKIKTKKKKKKRKNCSRRDCVHQQHHDVVTQSLTHAILRLNENLHSDFKNDPRSYPPIHFPPISTLRTLPLPSRITFSPGFHPGIIPLMDIVFV